MFVYIYVVKVGCANSNGSWLLEIPVIWCVGVCVYIVCIHIYMHVFARTQTARHIVCIHVYACVQVYIHILCISIYAHTTHIDCVCMYI